MNRHLAAALGLNPEIVSLLCCMLLDGWPEALLSCLSLRGLKGSRGMMYQGYPLPPPWWRPGWREEMVGCGKEEEPAKTGPKNHPLRRRRFLGRLAWCISVNPCQEDLAVFDFRQMLLKEG